MRIRKEGMAGSGDGSMENREAGNRSHAKEYEKEHEKEYEKKSISFDHRIYGNDGHVIFRHADFCRRHTERDSHY